MSLISCRPPLPEFKTIQNSEVLQKDDALKDDNNPIGGPGLNFDTVEWLETMEGLVNRKSSRAWFIPIMQSLPDTMVA